MTASMVNKTRPLFKSLLGEKIKPKHKPEYAHISIYYQYPQTNCRQKELPNGGLFIERESYQIL